MFGYKVDALSQPMFFDARDDAIGTAVLLLATSDRPQVGAFALPLDEWFAVIEAPTGWAFGSADQNITTQPLSRWAFASAQTRCLNASCISSCSRYQT